MRPSLFALALGVLGLALLGGCRSEAQPTVTVYKTPTCGCCALWADHMVEAGFEVERVDVSSLDDVKVAMDLLVLCVKLASVEDELTQRQENA